MQRAYEDVSIRKFSALNGRECRDLLLHSVCPVTVQLPAVPS